MNWVHLRRFPWLDTRARFVAGLSEGAHLLDLGASDGETLCHFAELRPDLRLYAVDMAGRPERYPSGCQFHRCDLEQGSLPWPDGSMDGITCMQLVEHLNSLEHLFSEIARLLRSGGRVFIETPHPKTLLYSSPQNQAAGTFTMNFYDDIGHTRPVSVGALAARARAVGLRVVGTGLSRNWLFVLASAYYVFTKPSRRKYTAWAHFRGWSTYLIAEQS
jgi:SAM-dependent methyltransferase